MTPLRSENVTPWPRPSAAAAPTQSAADSIGSSRPAVQTCSAKCRTALYRQRLADNEAEADALAQANAEAELQEKVRKVLANVAQVQAKRRAAAAEAERERHQEAVKEDAAAERRRQRYAPTVDNRAVVIVTDTRRYSGQMTPIPEDQKPAWR